LRSRTDLQMTQLVGGKCALSVRALHHIPNGVCLNDLCLGSLRHAASPCPWHKYSRTLHADRHLWSVANALEISALTLEHKLLLGKPAVHRLQPGTRRLVPYHLPVYRARSLDSVEKGVRPPHCSCPDHLPGLVRSRLGIGAHRFQPQHCRPHLCLEKQYGPLVFCPLCPGLCPKLRVHLPGRSRGAK
jgi:hypothetical protein